MTPNDLNVIDAPLAQRADRYREQAVCQYGQEEAERISEETAREARLQREQATAIWNRTHADDYLESQRQKRERQFRDEDLERELKRIRYERMYMPHQGLGRTSEPWWIPLVEMAKVVTPILITTAPLWVPPLLRYLGRPKNQRTFFRRSRQRERLRPRRRARRCTVANR